MKDDEPPNRTPLRAVLKFGGEVVANSAALHHVLGEVRTLTAEGWRFVIVHGGGPQSNTHAATLGLEVRKVAGRRVTDGPTLEVAKQILAGSVNVDVVTAARARSLDAVGLAGVSLLRASRRPREVVGPVAVDYGFVGEVEAVDTALIELLWSGGRVPVIAPLGVDAHGQAYNINADTVASAIAAAVSAAHLFLMTAAGGVLRDVEDPASRIPTLTPEQARAAIDEGVIGGGMIPKVADALDRLEDGIGVVHILGPDSLRDAATRPGAVGTAIRKAGAR
ncbi:MAG: acetylglutamate kinase [Nannocystaceae bacterium]|nr:acetylglutamate kinase [bacterium]